MSSRPVVTPAEAIDYLLWCVSWDGGAMPVYLRGSARPHAYLEGHDASATLQRRLERWERLESAQVELGLPERKRGVGASQSTVLWAWLESRDSARRLARRFKPLPSIVLKIGSSCRRLCIWPLTEPVPWVVLESSNKRLAYALHAPQKYAVPEKLRIPVPGTFIREGRKVPAAVIPTRMDLASFRRAQVVDGLRDPPPPWAQRMQERGEWR